MVAWFRRKAHGTPRRARSRHALPMLEALERRVVPTTFTVLNANDSGPGSLRQAVVSANGNGGTDDIVFDPTFFNAANPRTITLFAASGQLTITQSLTISGPGPAVVTVSGGGSVRPFNVDDANNTTAINVTLRGMTVTGGNGTSNGTTAGDGGGIRTANENLTLDAMVVTGNTAGSNDGGGVAAGIDAALTVRNSTVSGNTARRGGGVYFFQDGSLLLENSTVSGNVATDGGNGGNGGGGIYFLGEVLAGGFTVRNSTIAGNTSAGSGGGIVLRGLNGAAIIENSTITGNTANTTSSMGGYGGGGVAVSFGSGASYLTFVSSIVSGNAATAANGRSDIAAVPAAIVNALSCAIGDADGFTLSNLSGNNLPFLAALGLGTLANNGGPTQTISFAASSPLVNAGLNFSNLAFDQRGPGFPRQVDAGVDIGAFESAFDAPVASGGPYADVTAAGGATYTFDVTYSGATPIDVATLDGNDIRVTGPSGFSQPAQFVGVTPPGNGSPRTATYRVNAPGGTFGSEDNGFYAIRLEASQVVNTNGTPATAKTVGTFRVAIGQTFTVTNLNDSGAGSLRQAILDANATDNVSDTIAFQAGLTGTITLNPTVGQLSITDGVTINGPGAGVLTVSGGGAVRVFNVENIVRAIDVTIAGLRVTGGNGSSGGPTPVTGGGGGIRIIGERLTLNGMVVTGNTVVGANVGGGIAENNSAFLTIRNSTVSGNTASRGGGLFLGNGGLLMENSTVSGNTATDGNLVGFGGGGLYWVGGVTADGFTIRNSTIAGNTAVSSGGGLAFFGPIGTVLIQNSTITGNAANTTGTQAGTGGGGIALVGSNSTILTLESTIVSGNTASFVNGRSDIAADAPPTVNVNFCAVGDADGFMPSGTSGNNLPFGATLGLGTLGNFGGATQTIPISSVSLARNVGSNPANLSTDQRGPGFARVEGPAADIGAFEFIPLVVTNLNDAGPGSLRQALLAANATAGFGETIVFQAGLTGTIPLTSTLTISDSVKIAGPGAAALSVSGGNATRVFDIDNAGAAITVTLTGLTVTGGASSSNGGGIRVTNETLTLEGVAVTGNRTTGGAGGGGIAVENGGSLFVFDSTVSGNAAETISVQARGGGIFFLNGGFFQVFNSTVSGNTAASTRGGGGVYFYTPAAGSSITVRNSTIAGNAAQSGGGLSLRGVPGSNPVLLIQNSTITGNTSVTTSTTAGYGGGGIAVPANALFTPAITVVSSILSGNTATAANGRADLAMPNATPVNVNFSAVGDPDGFTPSGGSGNNLPFGTALGLGTLANNGGPTQTISFDAASPLRNAGANPAGLITDQRGPGFARVEGSVADIGAFEFQGLPRVTAVNVNAGQSDAVQRSRVTAIEVAFSTQVAFAGAVASAFQLSRIGGGAVGGFTATAAVVGGVTVVTLTGFTGAEARSGSLADGRFRLTVLAGQVTAGGQPLDGDGDGTGGDDFVRDGSPANGLFCFYGDATGDGLVNAADIGAFRSAFGTALGNPLYRDFLDFDNDGLINAADFAQFRLRFGATVP